jgi:hypothetical protein
VGRPLSCIARVKNVKKEKLGKTSKKLDKYFISPNPHVENIKCASRK